MTRVLRLYCIEPLDAKESVAWSLFDESTGACLERGRSVVRDAPAHERVEAVIAARSVRIVAVHLPQLSPARVRSAAGFAVEDQIAGAGEDTVLLPGPQAADGTVLVTLVERAVLAAVETKRLGSTVSRVIAEAALATVGSAWRWCSDPDSPADAFVRAPDGSAFPVSAVAADGALPPELELALRNVPEAQRAATVISVECETDAANLSRWSALTGMRFEAGTPWRWHAAQPVQFAAAVSLEREDAHDEQASPAPWRLFRPALILVLLAAVVHVGAMGVEWLVLKRGEAARHAAWIALGQRTAVNGVAASTDVATIRAAIDREFAVSQHAQGKFVADDALPVLSTATVAMGGRPPGSLKRATFDHGHWTFEWQQIDPTALNRLEAGLRAAGLASQSVRQADGVRLRVGQP